MHRKKYPGTDPGRKTTGIIVVIAFHLIVLWALITGTARKGLELIKKPMEAAVIQEVIIPPPPPPPPPPPKEIVKAPPKVEAPPPPFVPPPEVAPPPSNAPAIQSVQTPPTAPAVIAPPVAPAPPAPPAPPARINAAAACQIVAPQMPRQAIREGTTGTVVASAVIRGGKVTDIQLSGPRVFHSAIRDAMSQYTCNATEGQAVTQEFVFKLE
ncbi:energy transducer TonB [Ramlibacter sp. GTP1]|uniref:Energy transducer TonB n=2 Tax=Ramlibacter albus TaxID=2079448 RepID=A0A923M7V6_9BURK|nr:energy transducer TonB [Ramlibacter albus]